MKVPSGLPADMAALTEPLAVGHPRGGEEPHREGRRRHRARRRAGRAGVHRRAAHAAASAPSWSPTSRPSGASWPRCSAPTRWSTPRRDAAIEAWSAIDGVQAAGHLRSRRRARHDRPGDAHGTRGTRRILVVGACMQERPHLTRCWASARSSASSSCSATSRTSSPARCTAIAEGKIDLAPWLTGTVAVDGVPQAFADLANPEAHAKILVVPGILSASLELVAP